MHDYHERCASRIANGFMRSIAIVVYLAGGPAMAQDVPIAFTISAARVQLSVGDPLVLTAHFKNVGSQPITLLAEFEPLPVFFSIDIVDRVSECPLSTVGAGKTDFGRPPNVRTLAPSEELTVELHVAEVLAQPLKRGIYDLTVTYHNQYGDAKTLKGMFGSNTLRVRVLDKGE